MRGLDQLGVGEEAEVLRIGGPTAFIRRLISLGLAPGVRVQLARRAPMGDPLELVVGTMHLSMRADEAAFVLVSPPC